MHLTKIKVQDGTNEISVLWKKNLLMFEQVKPLNIALARSMVITDRSITVRDKCMVFETGICHKILDAKTLNLQVLEAQKIHGSQKLLMRVRDLKTNRFCLVVRNEPSTRTVDILG